MENAPPRRIPAARLLRPQGRRGELLAEPLTDLPGVFTAGRSVVLTGSPGPSTLLETTLEDVWYPTGKNAGRLVLKLAGCDSISAAELLAGRELLLLASDLPPLDSDTWFVRDLVGCTLFDRDTAVGRITAVEYAIAPDGRTRLEDAAPLLAVSPASAPPEAEPLLVPFVKAWLDRVDLEQHRVVMHLPEGLASLDTADTADDHTSEDGDDDAPE